MENDLISRKGLLKIYTHWLPQLERPEDAGDRNGVKTCIAVLQDAPAVDAIEVVRCKDCEFGQKPTVCERLGTVVKPNDFCSYGIRRKKDAVN